VRLAMDNLSDRLLKLLKTCGSEGKCKACGATIFWFMTVKNKKLIPYTSEGIPHFGDCPAADKFRKNVK